MENTAVRLIKDPRYAPSEIFSDEFQKTDSRDIVARIREDGYFCCESAMRPQFVDRILADVAAHPFAVNENWITGVYADTQYYLTHMLACSQAFADYVTHPRVFEICDQALGSDHYRLKAQRYYETYGGHHMQWHTDNKTDKSFAQIPGLIFIFYLQDIHDGEFQYVRGSHRFSGTKAYNDYSDDYIEKNHGSDVISFKAPKGTILIYDTYGIHRAKPVARRSFVRKSLFFQVDADCNSAEPILLNPAYIKRFDAKIARFLGFGLPAEYRVYPFTSAKSLPIRRIGFVRFSSWLGYRMIRGGYELLPMGVKAFVRRLVKGSLKK